jgi:hypothetical protein
MSEPLDESGAPVTQDTKDIALEQQIRVRAYERYLKRQGRPGSAENDWIEAEREVRSSSYQAGQRSPKPPQSRA